MKRRFGILCNCRSSFSLKRKFYKKFDPNSQGLKSQAESKFLLLTESRRLGRDDRRRAKHKKVRRRANERRKNNTLFWDIVAKP